LTSAGGAIIEAGGLRKDYAGSTVLDIEHLSVEPGEILAVLGPSGSGKSVLLRILNLLEPPTLGTISFGGLEVQELAGRKRLEVSRRMAMIFQDPLLFRGSVGENAAYGLKVRKVSGGQRNARVGEILDLVGLGQMSDKYVSTLSGGEGQRVALARALVIEPEVLLLDEPFASLDPPARHALQEETRSILRKRSMTAVFVTHDQDEAARLGDRVLLLDSGRIAQVGTPRSVFYEPETEFAARFMGVENIFHGEVMSCEAGSARVSVESRMIEVVTDRVTGERLTIGIRPEDIALFPAPEVTAAASSENAMDGKVTDIELRGPVARVTVACPFPLVALVTRRSLEELGIELGSQVGARFKATAVVVIGGPS
jgi:tungstate transport system ATP-binding protein